MAEGRRLTRSSSTSEKNKKVSAIESLYKCSEFDENAFSDLLDQVAETYDFFKVKKNHFKKLTANNVRGHGKFEQWRIPKVMLVVKREDTKRHPPIPRHQCPVLYIHRKSCTGTEDEVLSYFKAGNSPNDRVSIDEPYFYFRDFCDVDSVPTPLKIDGQKCRDTSKVKEFLTDMEKCLAQLRHSIKDAIWEYDEDPDLTDGLLIPELQSALNSGTKDPDTKDFPLGLFLTIAQLVLVEKTFKVSTNFHHGTKGFSVLHMNYDEDRFYKDITHSGKTKLTDATLQVPRKNNGSVALFTVTVEIKSSKGGAIEQLVDKASYILGDQMHTFCTFEDGNLTLYLIFRQENQIMYSGLASAGLNPAYWPVKTFTFPVRYFIDFICHLIDAVLLMHQ